METPYYIVFVCGLMCLEYLLFPTCFPKAFYAVIEGIFLLIYEHE
jgi:hypothetical protein